MVGFEEVVGPLAQQPQTAALGDVLPEYVVSEVLLSDVAAAIVNVGDGAADADAALEVHQVGVPMDRSAAVLTYVGAEIYLLVGRHCLVAPEFEELQRGEELVGLGLQAVDGAEPVEEGRCDFGGSTRCQNPHSLS